MKIFGATPARLLQATCQVLVLMSLGVGVGADQAPINHQPAAPDAVAIQQTLALFSIAVDQHRFDLFDDIFTPDATATFTPEPVVTGLPAIKSLLAKILTGTISQHKLSTLYINMTNPENEANVTNYLLGTFFGQGPLEGQVLSNYGYYQDIMTKQADGQWRVCNRVLHNFEMIGNTSILSGL